jgi:uncharacterized membrane protein
MYQATLFLHLAAAIIWMGGMTCLLFALRPATLAVMEAKPRALLMAEVWQRFFNIVLACVVVLFASGTNLYATGLRAAKAATGAGSVALGWNVMLVLGLVMFLIFGHIYFAGLKKFKRAVQAGEFPLAAQAAARIHTMVVANFVLGWVAIVCVKLLR